jgi:hypothetical protein
MLRVPVPARMDKRREVMITVFGRWKKIIGLSFSTLLAVKVQISASSKQRSSYLISSMREIINGYYGFCGLRVTSIHFNIRQQRRTVRRLNVDRVTQLQADVRIVVIGFVRFAV